MFDNITNCSFAPNLFSQFPHNPSAKHEKCWIVENRVKIPYGTGMMLVEQDEFLREKMDYFLDWRALIKICNPDTVIEDQILIFRPCGAECGWHYLECKLWVKFKDE